DENLKLKSPPTGGPSAHALMKGIPIRWTLPGATNYLPRPERRRLRPRRRRKGGQYAARCSGLRRTWPPSCARSCRPPEPPGFAQPACPRSAEGQAAYLHAWPAVSQHGRALELSSVRTRQTRPACETWPCRPAWSYRDPADAETGRCQAHEARTGTQQGLSG